MRQILHQVIRLFLIIAVGVGIWAAIYAYNQGFTRKWKRLIIQEFEKRGADAEIGKLTIDPFDGLVARNVKIFTSDENKSLLASINNITLDIDFVKLLRKKQFLRSVEFRDADLSLPIDPEKPTAELLKIKNLSAKIKGLENIIKIERSECQFNGMRITLVGSLIQSKTSKEKKLIGTLESKNINLIKKLRKFFAQIVTELNKFNFKKNDPPHLHISIVGDLDNIAHTTAAFTLTGTNIKREGYEFESIQAQLEYSYPTVTLKEIKAVDNYGTLYADARWKIDSDRIPFNIESSIDGQRLVRSILKTNSLDEFIFLSPTSISAKGNILIKKEPEKNTIPVELIGTFKCDRFVSQGKVFEGAYADFAFKTNHWYLRNLLIEHASGTVNGNILWNNVKGVQFDTTIKMDPTILTPFFKQEKIQKSLQNFEFRNNPTVNLSFSGNGPTLDPLKWTAAGHFTLGPCHYRQIPLTAATGRFEIQDKEIIFQDFRIDREEGYLNGEQVNIGKESGLISIKGVNGKVFPDKVAAYFSPKTAAILEHHRFQKPPNLTLSGVINSKKYEQSQLTVTFNATGKASSNLFERKIPLLSPKGTVILQGKKIDVAVQAGFLEGQINHVGSFVIDQQDKSFGGNLNFTNLNFGKLAALLELPIQTKGIINGNLKFNVPPSGAEQWSGIGSAHLTEGDIFAIPIMGPLSPIISGVLDQPQAGYSIAQSASVKINVNRGIIQIKDFQAFTPGFILRAKGEINGLQDTINIDAEMNARGPLQIVGWPISKLLRYKGEGTISNPKWRPANFSLPSNFFANGEKLIGQPKIPNIIPQTLNILPNALKTTTKALEILQFPRLLPRSKATEKIEESP